MASFLFLLIASLFVAVGKPQNSFPSAPEPGVLAQQLSGTAGASSVLPSNSDGNVPEFKLQDVDDNAISFQYPSTVESAITENSLNPSSALIASTPNSCSNPASKLHKRQSSLQLIWNGLQNLPFLNFLKPTPSDPEFCPNTPNALTREGEISVPKLRPETATQDKKNRQETTRKDPEPTVSGPEGPSCPSDYPQKVCCRGNLAEQRLIGFGALLDQCWDCELLQLTLWTHFVHNVL